MRTIIDTKEELKEKVKNIELRTDESREFLEQKYSGRSRDTRRSQLKKYLAYRNMTGKELIDEAEEDWSKSRREREYIPTRMVNEFKEKLDEFGYSEWTISNIVGCVRAFYKFHKFPLDGDRINRTNATAKKENRVKGITKDVIKRLYNSASSKRNKALLLFLYQTGQGSSEVAKLKFGDVKKELIAEKYPLMIDYEERKGTGLSYCTFLGADGIHALKEYLKERAEKLDLESWKEIDYDAPLFAKRGGEEPISADGIGRIMRYMAKNAPDDVITDEEMEKSDLNPLRPHAFRKNFKTTLTPVANDFAIEYMMGHQLNGIERTYFVSKQGGREGLREIYKNDMEPELSIDATSTEAEVTVSPAFDEGRREKLTELIGDEFVFKEDYKNLKERLTKTKMELSEAKSRINDLEEKIGKIDQLGELLASEGELAGLKEVIEDKVEEALREKK